MGLCRYTVQYVSKTRSFIQLTRVRSRAEGGGDDGGAVLRVGRHLAVLADGVEGLWGFF